MFRAGFAQFEILPGDNEPFMGHLREDYAARGTHDSLYCKAAVFAENGIPATAILTLDVCMVPESLVRRIRTAVRDDSGIPEDAVMVAATHTHASAATCSLYGAPSSSSEFIDGLLTSAAVCCRNAAADLQPATLRYGEAVVPGIAFCRRLDAGGGRVRMNWENPRVVGSLPPVGIPDETLRVLAVERESGTGLLVNFALHPAVLDYENRGRSADFPGALARRVEKSRNGKTPCLFLNGFCGDVNHLNPADPSLPRRGYEAVERIAEALAGGVDRALDTARPIAAAPLRRARHDVSLRRIPVPAEGTGGPAGAVAAAEGTDGLPPDLARAFRDELRPIQDEPLPAEVQAFRLGPLGLAALPGEIFTGLGIRLRDRFAVRNPDAPLIAVSLANGAIGYVPHKEAFAQGGYETLPGVTRIAPGQGEVLTDAAADALESLYANHHPQKEKS